MFHLFDWSQQQQQWQPLLPLATSGKTKVNIDSPIISFPCLSLSLLFAHQVRDLQKSYSDAVLNLLIEQHKEEFKLFEFKYHEQVGRCRCITSVLYKSNALFLHANPFIHSFI